jgi:hypothetical protein
MSRYVEMVAGGMLAEPQEQGIKMEILFVSLVQA